MPNLKTATKQSNANGDTANLYAVNEKLTEQVTLLTKRMSEMSNRFREQEGKLTHLEEQNRVLTGMLEGKPPEKKRKQKVAITIDNMEARLQRSGMSPEKQREVLRKIR